MDYENYDEVEEFEIDKKKGSIERRLKKIKERHDKHKEEWITYADAVEYRDRAEKLPYNGCQDIGERRALKIELMERFGLGEVEAINILNGYHMRDIVQRYDNIKNIRIPNNEKTEIIIIKEKIEPEPERLESDYD